MPTRYLKPGICDSEKIDACSPLAEVLFYRLLVNVDDFGRMDARPALVKSKCFPVRETITPRDVDALLAELSQNGLIAVYLVGGKPYLQMLKWDNKARAAESKCPAYDHTCIHVYAEKMHQTGAEPADDENTQQKQDAAHLHTSVCKPPTFLPVTVTVTETETVTGSAQTQMPADENPTRAKRACQLPADFYPDETGLRVASEGGICVPQELAKFTDYHKAKGSTMKDWQAAWRTWARNSITFNRQQKGNFHDQRQQHWDELTGARPDAGLIQGTAERLD